MATETIRTDSRDGPAGRRRARSVVGVVLLAAGVVLLAATGGYYLYGKFARSNLDDLRFEAQRPRFAGQGYGPTTPAAAGAAMRTPPQSAAAAAPNEPQSTSAVDGPQSTGAPQGAVPTVVGASAGAAAGNPRRLGRGGRRAGGELRGRALRAQPDQGRSRRGERRRNGSPGRDLPDRRVCRCRRNGDAVRQRVANTVQLSHRPDNAGRRPGHARHAPVYGA